MRILLINPGYPDTFWSFKHALRFIFKKATNPPLGLLTVAAMLPEAWEKRLVDMDVTPLRDKDLRWADYVFLTGISVQRESIVDVIARCKRIGVKIVAGGPLFTTGYEEFDNDIDHFVLNEAENTLPPFLEDLKNGTPKHLYTSNEWADLTHTPAPLWGLVNMKRYAAMNIQYSRGCPYNCEFCDITLLYGRAPRTKTRERLIGELEGIYSTGWRGEVFFVDDNFIGNKRKIKTDILPGIIQWMKKRRYPFSFFTQASIELSDDSGLMRSMADAGFDTVFVGIETPDEDSLKECSKFHNKGRDLIGSVKRIQQHGLQVQGGFIVGFDNDPFTIFERQIRFIQKSGITTAMVGLLNALRGTRLYQRLKNEDRLIKDMPGDNTNYSINFTPKMNHDTLMNGYKKIIRTIYAPRYYYERVRTFFKDYTPSRRKIFRLRTRYLMAFAKSLIQLGVIGKERFYYWRLIIWTLIRRPQLFPQAVTFAIYGFHFRKVFEKFISV